LPPRLLRPSLSRGLRSPERPSVRPSWTSTKDRMRLSLLPRRGWSVPSGTGSNERWHRLFENRGNPRANLSTRHLQKAGVKRDPRGMEILILAAGAGPGAGSRPIETANHRTWQNTSARDCRGAFAKSTPCKDFRSAMDRSSDAIELFGLVRISLEKPSIPSSSAFRPKSSEPARMTRVVVKR
jgi:hypothetical protein